MAANGRRGESLYDLSQKAVRAGRRWIEGDVVEVWRAPAGDRRAVVEVRGRWLYLGLEVEEYQLPDLLTVGAVEDGLVVGCCLTGPREYGVWTERVRGLIEARRKVVGQQVASSR